MTKSVLITGATGVVGSALTPLFLNEPDTEIWLLIRAADDAELHKRLDGLFGYWSNDVSDPTARSRVRAVRGNVSEPGLGLAPTAYATMAGRLTHIVHAAASVKMNMSETEARRSSVDGVLQIVKLADTCREHGQFRKLDYVSTLGVAGCMSSLIPERALTEPRGFHNTYESSKAEAERLVLGRVADGFPATIHRPSMVVGNSHSGKIIHFQVFYFLSRFLSGSLTFGLVPRLPDIRLDIVPSDYVAAAVHWATGADWTTGRIMHLCSGPQNSIPIMELARGIRAFLASTGAKLPPLIRVPMPVFVASIKAMRLMAGHDMRRRLENLSRFLDYANDRQLFDNTQSELVLSSAGISLPAPDTYLHACLAFYTKSYGRSAPVREHA